MTNNTPSETPIFDELNAQRKTFPDLLTSVEVDDTEPTVTEKALADTALAKTEIKKRVPVPLKGWSPSSQEVLRVVNDAILDGKRTINGESFGSYADAHIKNGYIVAAEIPRLRETIRTL